MSHRQRTVSQVWSNVVWFELNDLKERITRDLQTNAKENKYIFKGFFSAWVALEDFHSLQLLGGNISLTCFIDKFKLCD